MNNKQILIIITGMPGTGKTTLGKRLSKQYRMPFISKDALKERMFDTLGHSDKEWSLKVSATAHRIMDDMVGQQLASGGSVIVESNFKREPDSARFSAMQKKYDCRIVQILCWADGEIVFKRFAGRIGKAERHEGHAEAIPMEQIHAEFVAAGGKDTPLELNGTFIELDTTDLEHIDYAGIDAAVEAARR